MASDRERKAKEREKMRSDGYVLKQLWVHPDRLSDFDQIKTKLRKSKIKKSQ